jgi:two-component system phosphate regulon sensor histidine kinase PhoR
MAKVSGVTRRRYCRAEDVVLNASLANRLRIGFAITFAMLAVVAVIGVGNVLELRHNFEQRTERSFERQIDNPAHAEVEARYRAALDRQVTEDTRRTTILFGALLVACLLTAGFVFDRLIASIQRPLQRLVDAAGKLASGDLRARVSVRGPSETAALGVAFNEMADELQSAYRRTEDSRERLSVTLESLSDGVITVNESGTVTDANPAARRLVPWADVGAPIRELLAGLADRRTIERLLAGGEPEEIHFGEGESTLAMTASKLGAQEGGTVLSVRDISERSRLERMRDDFVLTASHELRSPLTSVQGFAELLMLERDRLSPKQAETVEIILDNTRHLVRLLNDLLDMARSDAGRLAISPVPTGVEPLVSEAVRTMRPQTEARGQSLEFEIEPGLPQVSVEPDRIRQVLINLLTNAHEYCPDGASIKVTAMRGADGVVIAVSDDGPGISAKQLEHVFERFVRGEAGLTQRVGGTGLGLAISKSLVELHGGSIDVDSAPGQGSTFRVVLPAIAVRGRPSGDERVLESG